MNRQIQSANAAFQFTSENYAQLQQIIAQYPHGRAQSAVIAALDLAQRQHHGWISREVIEEVAKQLAMPEIRVHEIASFYTMFNLQPVGQYHLQVCTTTPCWLRGSDTILYKCQRKREKYGESVFTVTEVECLGACVNAPILQVNDDYHENLNGIMTDALLENLANGNKDMTTTTIIKDNNPLISQVDITTHDKTRARAKTELDAAVQTLSKIKTNTNNSSTTGEKKSLKSMSKPVPTKSTKTSLKSKPKFNKEDKKAEINE